ncbi:hypothetical protein [Konateibacter massiliensis]|uniref:hypothetical protein n=1 Tax=Konateibacter massiliensis TaxID=2002841 RepID=UPI000C15C4C8|nr:hypothetical protein [Konateibacter massiliensis]
MSFRFNPFDVVEYPNVYLCEVDKSLIGALKVNELNFTAKFNDINELSFNVPRSYYDINGNRITCPYYDKIEALRVIYVEELGYFEIQEPKIVKEGDSKEYKEILAFSLEYRFTRVYLDDFDINTGEDNSIDDVQFYNTNNTSLSLLHICLEKMSAWSIGHIDIGLTTKKHSFSIDYQDVYSFLKQNVSDSLGCVFLFNTYNNTINIYEEDNIGENTSIYVSFQNLIKEINVDYKCDDIITSLKVNGGEDKGSDGENLNIRELNLGQSNIVDLSFYHTDEWMGADLVVAYKNYLDNFAIEKVIYQNLTVGGVSDLVTYTTQLDTLINKICTVASDEYGLYDNSFWINYPTSSHPAMYYDNFGYNQLLVEKERLEDLIQIYEQEAGTEYEDYKVCVGKLRAVNQCITTATVTKVALQNSITIEKTKLNGDTSGELGLVYYRSLKSTLYNRIYTLTDAETEMKEGKDVAQFWYNYAETEGSNSTTTYYDNFGMYQLNTELTSLENVLAVQLENKAHESTNPTTYAGYMLTLGKKLGVKNAIVNLNKRLTTIDTYISETQVKVTACVQRASISNFLTTKQKQKLESFIHENEYDDSNYAVYDSDSAETRVEIKQELYEAAYKNLVKISSPQLSFSMEMKNIFAIPAFKKITDKFELGNYINVEIRKDYVKKVRILGYTFNFDDLTDFSCEFGDLLSLRSEVDIHAELLANAVTAGNAISEYKAFVDENKNIIQDFSSIIQEGLDAAVTQVKSTGNMNEVTMDGSGIHLRKIQSTDGSGNITYSGEEGWITGNVFLYSDDNFKTAKSALGKFSYKDISGTTQTKYGLLAEAVIAGYIGGSEIVGNSIVGGSIAIYNTAKGITFSVNNDGELVANKATIKGTLTAESGSSFGDWHITNAAIYRAGYNANDDNSATPYYKKTGSMYYGNLGLSVGSKFYVDSAGKVTCTDADIYGTLTCTSTSTGNIVTIKDGFINFSKGGTNYATINFSPNEDKDAYIEVKKAATFSITNSSKDYYVCAVNGKEVIDNKGNRQANCKHLFECGSSGKIYTNGEIFVDNARDVYLNGGKLDSDKIQCHTEAVFGTTQGSKYTKITNGGKLLIGRNEAPGDYLDNAIYVEGGDIGCTGNMACTKLYESSTEKIKTNISTYDNSALSLVNNSIIYQYNLVLCQDLVQVKMRKNSSH